MHPEHERENQEIEALLRQLDHPMPRVAPEAVIARARRGPARWRRWAAGIVLALGAVGAAYAAPGSPVPAWLQALAGGPVAEPPAPVPEEAAALPSEAGEGGVSLDAREGVLIELRPATSPGYVRVSLIDGTEIHVQAPAGAASFRSEPNRLLVEQVGTDTLEIRIPRDARRLEVRSGGRRILLKDGPELSAVAQPGVAGTYLLPLDPRQ